LNQQRIILDIKCWSNCEYFLAVDFGLTNLFIFGMSENEKDVEGKLAKMFESLHDLGKVEYENFLAEYPEVRKQIERIEVFTPDVVSMVVHIWDCAFISGLMCCFEMLDEPPNNAQATEITDLG
jgi:hypothetical protein